MQHSNVPHKDLLKFSVIGSVDDGKSTLIGRLLYECGGIYEDQLEALRQNQMDQEELKWAYLTDGLSSEQEQGITIDVAYRYFSTERRKYIISDCPGHFEYTRNMITGSANVQTALLLIDITKGISEQFKRHLFLASLLQIKNFIICINKIDRTEYNEEAYLDLKNDILNFIQKLEISHLKFIPLSALKGDNITKRSLKTPWYKGLTLIETLEDCYSGSEQHYIHPRFPIQTIIKQGLEDYKANRGFAGKVESGTFKRGEEITLLPSKFTTKIREILSTDGKMCDETIPGLNYTFLLEDEFDLSRGCMICRPENQPQSTQEIDVMLCCLSSQEVVKHKKYSLIHTTQRVQCMIQDYTYKIDIHTLSREKTTPQSLKINDIARVKIKLSQPIHCDSFERIKSTGTVLLVDPQTHQTLAIGFIR